MFPYESSQRTYGKRPDLAWLPPIPQASAIMRPRLAP
jgi:hypothetical protein